MDIDYKELSIAFEIYNGAVVGARSKVNVLSV